MLDNRGGDLHPLSYARARAAIAAGAAVHGRRSRCRLKVRLARRRADRNVLLATNGYRIIWPAPHHRAGVLVNRRHRAVSRVARDHADAAGAVRAATSRSIIGIDAQRLLMGGAGRCAGSASRPTSPISSAMRSGCGRA